MFILSITAGSMLVIAYAVAFSFIKVLNKCLLHSEIFLESLICSKFFKREDLIATGLITDAAITGPAKQPRPASSVPHSYLKLEKLKFNIIFFGEDIDYKSN